MKACGSRSRSPGVRSPLHQPALARDVDGRRHRARELLLQLDVRRGRLPQLQRQRQLDAPARQPLLQQRAQPRLEVGQRRRQPELQVEKPVIDGADGDADRARARPRA